MDEKIYKIILADGTVLSNLKLNGNNYISNAELTPANFIGNCSPVVISDGSSNEIHENMALVQVTKVHAEHWFVLRDISSEELAKIKMQSDIEYVAMMAGVEL